jgi:hypothetical protein
MNCLTNVFARLLRAFSKAETGERSRVYPVVSALDILRDKQVKNFFLGVLRCRLSDEEKYQKFVSYFELVNQLLDEVSSHAPKADLCDPEKLAGVVSAAAQEAGLWKPERILETTRESVERAVHRVANCQHQDGGWGYHMEQSNVWGTAYGLLALKQARTVLDVPFAWEDHVGKAIDWMKKHYREWCVGRVPPEGAKPVYEASVATRCLCRVGERSFFAVSESLARLAEAQNQDGGWDAHIWGVRWWGPTRVYSEVGATSLALQALVEAGAHGYRQVIENGMRWIIATQNDDGSWSDGSCKLDNPKVDGEPRITKTCDALTGILVATAYGIPDEFQTNRERAVNWLLGQEKLLSKESGSAATGWGYDEFASEQFRPDLESTCHILETLVNLGDVSLPFATANARWLIDAQHLEPKSIEDGKWEGGDTFRITLALTEYYKRIKTSPLFTPARRAR